MKNVSEKDMGWIIDYPKMMTIETVHAARLFFALCGSMDLRTLWTEVDLPPQIKGLNRQTLWRAFKELEDKGMIRRPRGSRSWSVVYINPLVIRPYWMKGEQLNMMIKAFLGEPTVGFNVGSEEGSLT